jgi:hypothetical protein
LLFVPSGELLASSGDFMLARFKEVCESVMEYKDHKDHLVRETVVSLLPKLVRGTSNVKFCSPSRFAD